ncbi:MAG TPA: NUDIX hydrolase [Candidatus Hydrogenedentes bacterium]|nr:NUDIX hydrolase [Candidatus Hydrogenedentota bacterium]
MEVWRHSEIVYDGKIVRLRVGEVTLESGETAIREVVEHPGGSCVIPFTGHSVILVKQYRVALGKYILEAPAGKIEGDEDPAHRAACEMEEETGYRAGRIVSIGHAYSTVGFCSEKIHMFLAFDLEKTEQRLEYDENIEVVELSLEEVRRGLAEHTIEDGKTIIGLHALLDMINHPSTHP